MPILHIVRNKENPYVIINKEILWDDRLSSKSCILGARLMSTPDNFQISSIDLSNKLKWNIKKVHAALKELHKLGYCFSDKINDWEKICGKFFKEGASK